MPVVDINPTGPLCSDVGIVILEGTPNGGTFSGNGIVDPALGTV